MWHPWRRLRDLSHVDLRWQESDDELGHADHAADAVTITLGMTQAERRSTLTHELIHLERGPVAPMYRDSEDAIVRRLTAERLIPFDELVEALFWCYGEADLAEHFHVDGGVVVDRLRGLTHEQTRHINTEMDRREKTYGGGC